MSTIARFNWENTVTDDATGKEIVVSHKNDIRWDPVSGGFEMCEGNEEFAQTIEAVVKTVLGELQTNRDYGIPYFTTIFNDRRHNDIWESAVREAVEALPFVVRINSFEYEYDEARLVLTYQMEVTVSGGEVVIAAG